MPESNLHPHWSNSLATSQAKQSYLSFMERYKSAQEQVRTMPLVVLVWGPGSSGGDVYEKRVQIRESLRGLGHVAMFSEDIDGDDPATDLPSHVRELLQAREADFIIVIQASAGSTAEVHDFVGIDQIARKMLVFINEDYTQGYSYTGALQAIEQLYHNVHKFKYPDDIHQCNLLGSVLKKVQALQWAKFIKQER